jgi:tRNA pseudouridine38-40 synthase
MALRNIKLTIAYDGSEYHGWQLQPGCVTVQGVLTEALRDLLGPRARICGASRTDAGVSALGQVGLIQIDTPIPTENFAKAITDRLPESMAIVKAEDVPMGFDVIGDVKNKLYRYTIYCGPVRPVLHMRHCWHIPAVLDLEAMRQAASFLVGKKDFKSFAAAADHREDSVRTIFRCEVAEAPADESPNASPMSLRGAQQRSNLDPGMGDGVASLTMTGSERWIYVEAEGDGFLYNMVRNIVGTLVEVGLGRWQPEKIPEILEARDRKAAGPIAPPNGLCLMWIKY